MKKNLHGTTVMALGGMAIVSALFLESSLFQKIRPFLAASVQTAALDCASQNPTIPANALNVKKYGAKGDGATDDTAAINAAIAKAAMLGGLQTVYLPTGHYKITSIIKPNVDNLTFIGNGPNNTVLDNYIPGPNAIAMLVQKPYVGTAACTAASDCFQETFSRYTKSSPATRQAAISTAPIQYVKNLTLKDFSIQTHGNGQGDAGQLTLNAAQNVLVDTVNINGDAGLIGLHVNGVATSNGTSGTIKNMIISQVSKPGVYISNWSHDLVVSNVTVENTYGDNLGAGRSYGAGFTDAGTNITFENIKALNNQGTGILIDPIDITTGITRGMPPVGLTIRNALTQGNGLDGIDIDSAFQAVPQNISVSGIESDSNGGYGMKITAGENVSVDSLHVHDNGGVGLYLGDLSGNASISPGPQPAPTGIAVQNGTVANNMKAINSLTPGIYIKGHPQFTLNNVSVPATTNAASKQRGAVSFIDDATSLATLSAAINNLIVGGLPQYDVLYGTPSLKQYVTLTNITRQDGDSGLAAPVISLIGDNPLVIPACSTFVDPGATAIDSAQRIINGSIRTSGTVDTSAPGSYQVTYRATDAAGDATAARTVIVSAPPAIVLDVCPNIDGLQASVPTGMSIDALGDCVAIATPPILPPDPIIPTPPSGDSLSSSVSVAPATVAPLPAAPAVSNGFWSFIPFIDKTPAPAKAPAVIVPAVPTHNTGKKNYTIVGAEYSLNGVLVHTASTFPDGWTIDTTTLQDGDYTLITLLHYADGTTDTTTSPFTVDNTPNLVQRTVSFIEKLFKK